ncbi:DUF4271 domain-containing protein [Cecembia lonarensis]|uniref:DUF4271 domain-containing protein n=1 Tax=Cecembia lonarensis (strain CCUG 58316 / KCTC 22772 / LW9) TaxID=1225176 RepID=K1L0U4_CECL9|nr:DUF4271 domain-containing protein [Cecembia lonarensis]EKB48396.1 hypothetical protein B879_02979 [Cecembia lonarensis LW9]
MKKSALFLFLLFFLTFHVQAQVIENYQSSIDFTKPQGFFNKIASAKVDLDILNFPNSEFRFEIPGEASVFFDGRLWMLTEKDTSFTISTKVIKDKYAEGTNKVRLEVLGPHISPENLRLYKGLFEDVSEPMLPFIASDTVFEKREITAFEDFFVLALVILMLLFAIFKVVFPTVLRFVVQPKTIFTAEDFSDSGSIQKFFSLDVLFYLFIVNLGVSLFGMLFFKISGLTFSVSLVESDINSLFFIWLMSAIVLALVSLFKFLFLKVLVFLFDLNKYDLAHFFYLLRIISISMLLLLGVSVYFYFNHREMLEILLIYGVKSFFWLYLMGVMLMFLIMVNRVPFKNYHLFAYICSAELIPFLIFVKVLTG